MRKTKTTAAFLLTVAYMMSMLTSCSQNTQTDETENKSNIQVSANDTEDLSTIGNGTDKTDTDTTDRDSSEVGSVTNPTDSSEEESAEISTEDETESQTDTETGEETGEETEDTGEETEISVEDTQPSADKETESETTVEETTGKPVHATEDDSNETTKQPETTEETTVETTEETTEETTKSPVTLNSISASVVKATRYIGDRLTAADFNVTANMSDGTEFKVTGFSAEPLNLTAATNTITVTYKDKKTTVKVEAKEVLPVSITASVTGNHYIGDTLTAADFNVSVKMNNGTTLINPAGFTASPMNLTAASNNITITYGTASTTIPVNALERPQENPQPEPPAQPEQPAPEQPPVDTTEYIYFNEGIIDDLGRTAFNIQNTFRTEAGVSELKWSNDLYAIACIRAKELVADYSHKGAITSGENIDIYTFYHKVEVSQYENHINNAANGLMLEWKNSPGHYKTLTAAHYEYGAIACYRYNASVFCVAVFSEYDGFGEYETKCDEKSIAAVKSGLLKPVNTLNDPPDVFKIDYVKLFWFPKQIPDVPGLFENMTYGDYCRSIGKYQ